MRVPALARAAAVVSPGQERHLRTAVAALPCGIGENQYSEGRHARCQPSLLRRRREALLCSSAATLQREKEPKCALRASEGALHTGGLAARPFAPWSDGDALRRRPRRSRRKGALWRRNGHRDRSRCSLRLTLPLQVPLSGSRAQPLRSHGRGRLNRRLPGSLLLGSPGGRGGGHC